MITRIKLPLTETEFNALFRAARADLRNPTDQVLFIVRTELGRRGLLQPDQYIECSDTQKIHEVIHDQSGK